ncbi:MAG TPA: tripartite tricarboxylate transporter substrate binding protein [Pelagibacterium sp.]|uniref:tripartite tricarboxylate transporter substrate binding protein n=1 Tax=Pelagibacterium sp. TaxID=1967288 RepID=UPI002C5F1895|nr:tripartite tricarboxylate transporter substrate binding protein [Pelagibacterium sp.]HWJ88854.1 tripartite tricarboxylate transporter substrate binding protein [Pelagibacterium sp.]
MTFKAFATGAMLGLAALTATGAALAQDYPTRTIQIIVPYAPGGQGDITARLIAEHLSPALGKPVVVENRPGANGTIGGDLVAKSDPDGYTLEVVVQSHVLAGALMPGLTYDPVDDFEPISLMARTQLGVVVPASLPVETLGDFVDYIEERPGELGFASAGHGSNAHIFTEWFLDMADLDMIHVPYAGSAAAHPDLISGVATMAFDTLASVQGLVGDGRLKLLAVAGAERHPEFPDVPTIAESGFPEYDASSWSALLAPAGTPQEIVDRLNSEVVAILAREDVAERLATLGATIVASSPQEAREIMEDEVVRYTDLIERLELAQ